MGHTVEEIKQNMPDATTIADLAELFKVFGDVTRARILYCLEEGELCVMEIAHCLEMTKSAVSHQLRILRTAKLVKTRKDGKEVYYSLDDDHVQKIFSCAMEHIRE